MSDQLKILLAIVLFCFNSLAIAEQRWFQVELIVFQQKALNSEVFTQDISEIEPIGRYARTSKGNKTLNYIYKRLKRSRNYRPFYYQSWRIPVSSGRISLPIDVQKSGSNLTGWIKIQRGYLLHVIADIEFSPPAHSEEKRVYRLTEKRRLLLNEVHYLDHPVFGAVVKVAPVN